MLSTILKSVSRPSGKYQRLWRRHRRLYLEQLESRRTLATNTLGLISGTVFVDSDGSTTPGAGEGIANALVQLYEDTDNDNSFDPDSDTLIQSTSTSADGGYAFDGLTSGNYFAVQPAQVASGASLAEQVSTRHTVDGSGVATQLVDDFFGDSGPTIDDSPAGSPVTQSFPAATAMGGTRKFTAEFLEGLDGEQVSIRTESMMLRVNPDVQAIGRYTVTWDGTAGSFDPTGLGVNLLAADGAGLCLTEVFVDQQGGSVAVRVYTDGTNFSEATISSLTPLVPNQDFFLSFGDALGDAQFAPVGGAGADFSNVGAIQLEFNASQIAMDGSISNLGVLGFDRATSDFLNEPPAPQIDLEKLTNGFQADNATDDDVPLVQPGSDITWTYQVSNTGTVNITSVTLDDDRIGTITDLIDGDNGNLILEPGEVWIYQATGTAIEGTYSNLATVTGSAPGAPNAVDTDMSHYRGAVSLVDIEKLTNGIQADNAGDADVPQIAVGSNVTWTYRVTNTGNLDLSNVQVTDSVIGSVTNIIDQGDGDDILAPDEMWILEESGIALAGVYENVGTVTAISESMQTVTDQDTSHYFGADTAIDLEKLTNGLDADTVGTGPTVRVGETVTFTYLVTNAGNLTLSNVRLIDDNGTPGDTSDDFEPTFMIGDTDGDNRLDTNETWEFQATRVATLGDFQNTGFATGDSPSGEEVSDQDPSNHRGVLNRRLISMRMFLASSFD